MKWLFFYRRDLIVSYVVCWFLHFFISFKYDFHVDAERMIVKTREMKRNICVDRLKNVWHDISSVGKNCRYL